MYDKQRFTLYQGCFLVMSFCILWVCFPIGGSLDLALIDPWVSKSGQFLLRDNWYLAELNHRYVKDLLILVYVSFLVVWLASFKFEKIKSLRWTYGYFFAMVIGTLPRRKPGSARRLAARPKARSYAVSTLAWSRTTSRVRSKRESSETLTCIHSSRHRPTLRVVLQQLSVSDAYYCLWSAKPSS